MDQFRRPNGIFNAKIEPTGRLKLPAEVRDWLRGNGFKTVFVTSIDMKFVSIYPPPVWTAFERALENTEANYEDAQAVLLVARANGANSPVDDTGRITIRINGQLHKIGLDRTLDGTRVIALIHGHDIRVINAATGEVLRTLTINPNQRYHGTGQPPGPKKTTKPEPK